ncbi:MAG: LLM class flavin-dependent oxidoreductase [Deltaproteobacteria bacterium]|nr:LLM class flavin-dependent oxidoreductase [Deltaproteobacteria bacterium]MBW2363346.1 LLM class flavin-dependent oxidoreductase [Deltaproteobacteria bacterium]
MPHVDFGLCFNFRNPKPFETPFPEFYEEMLKQIEAVEALGFDTVWLPEHHFSPEDGYNPSPLAMAAAIAARTERIKIGTWLVLLPLHHALRIAEDAAVIDNLSNGRFMLGMGLGYRKEEYEAYGVDRSDRASLMEEGLTVLCGALGDAPFSFSGRHYQVKAADLHPKPVQRPLPIWVGARSTPAARRAARHDASLLLIDVGGNARATYETYASTLRERGRNPAEFGVHGMMLDSFFISDDPGRTREQLRPFVEFDATAMAGWYEESALSGHDPVLLEMMESGGGMRPPGLEEMVVPDASHTIRAIERKLEEAPYTHLVFGGGNTTPSGLSAGEMFPYLERFAREVIPHFR